MWVRAGLGIRVRDRDRGESQARKDNRFYDGRCKKMGKRERERERIVYRLSNNSLPVSIREIGQVQGK